MTWALFPGEELFAPAAAAETLRSDDLDSSSMYSKVCRTRIIRLETFGLGFRVVAVDGMRGKGCRAKFVWGTDTETATMTLP